jgi:hypothetical protein
MSSMSKSSVKRCILPTKKARLLSTSVCVHLLGKQELPDFLRGLRILAWAYLSAIEDYLPLYINHDSHHSGFDGDLQAQVGHGFESTPGRDFSTYKNRL